MHYFSYLGRTHHFVRIINLELRSLYNTLPFNENKGAAAVRESVSDALRYRINLIPPNQNPYFIFILSSDFYRICSSPLKYAAGEHEKQLLINRYYLKTIDQRYP